jgi:hypothetical protein
VPANSPEAICWISAGQRDRWFDPIYPSDSVLPISRSIGVVTRGFGSCAEEADGRRRVIDGISQRTMGRDEKLQGRSIEHKVFYD